MVAAVAAGLLVLSCASAPKEKRSLKWNAEKISDIKKAKIFAENFDMNVVKDEKLENGSIFIAVNDQDEKVVLYELSTPDVKETYSYAETNGNASSLYSHQLSEITFLLKNTDKAIKYDAPGYYIKSSDVDYFTRMCCIIREAMRRDIINNYKIALWDVLEVKSSDF